jgi:hypothetical protein
MRDLLIVTLIVSRGAPHVKSHGCSQFNGSPREATENRPFDPFEVRSSS